ncbi:hypothetical protein OROHE_021974 [Orobanche hederae]
MSMKHGNKVEAMLYRTDVDLLKSFLKPNETYLISNAVVRPVNPGFKNPMVDNNYQWITSAKTTILPTEERAFVSSTLAPVFTCYDHFHRLIGTTTLISNTMDVIIGKHEPRSVLSRGKENTLREYVAIDEAFKPFIITFWNDAIPEDIYNLLDSVQNQHVIAALNFHVTNYHAMSRSVQHPLPSSCLNLKTGVSKNLKNVLGRFISTVKAKLVRTNQRYMYLCCDRCHCLTSAEYGSLFECRSCHINKIATPRYRFSLLVFDETGEIDVTVFRKEGDKLLNISDDDFWQKDPDASFKSSLEQMMLKIEIQSKIFNKQNGAAILSYIVHSLECQNITPLPAQLTKLRYHLPLQHTHRATQTHPNHHEPKSSPE